MKKETLMHEAFTIDGLSILIEAILLKSKAEAFGTMHSQEFDVDGGEFASLYKHICKQRAYLEAASDILGDILCSFVTENDNKNNGYKNK